MASVDDIITSYFMAGYNYNEILHAVTTLHGFRHPGSMRSLHRALRRLGLYRHGHHSSTNSIISHIRNELNNSGSCIGYRQMHQRCQRAGLNTSREVVRIAVKFLDPDGVEERKRKHLRRRQYFARGPNYVWHIDGYDKLKPYGFSIHGAIDGFSRRIMWLRLDRSNKEPVGISSIYVNCLKEIGGVPRKVVGDYGTENIYVAAGQRFFRRNHLDASAGYHSFKYGRSVSNQRIEALWSLLRRSCTTWWMNFFKDLIEQDKYDNTNNIEVECLLFCFYKPLLSDLLTFRETWNSHRIRSQVDTTNNYRPVGRPDVLYFMPELTDPSIRDYKYPADEQDITAFIDFLDCELFVPKFICSQNFYELGCIIMSQQGWHFCSSAIGALSLYENLLQCIDII